MELWLLGPNAFGEPTSVELRQRLQNRLSIEGSDASAMLTLSDEEARTSARHARVARLVVPSFGAPDCAARPPVAPP